VRNEKHANLKQRGKKYSNQEASDLQESQPAQKKLGHH